MNDILIQEQLLKRNDQQTFLDNEIPEMMIPSKLENKESDYSPKYAKITEIQEFLLASDDEVILNQLNFIVGHREFLEHSINSEDSFLGSHSLEIFFPFRVEKKIENVFSLSSPIESPSTLRMTIKLKVDSTINDAQECNNEKSSIDPSLAGKTSQKSQNASFGTQISEMPSIEGRVFINLNFNEILN